MYEKRLFWVPFYLKDVFWAGMIMSSRSESIVRIMTCVNSNTMLYNFVVQYDKAVAVRRRTEEDKDFHK